MMFHKSIYNLIAWHAPTSWQREQLHGLQDYGGVTFWRLSVFVCACTCRYDFLGVVHGCVFSRVYFCVRGFSCVHAWVYLLYMEGVLWGVSFCNFSNSGILFAVSPYLSMDVFSGGLPVSTY